MPLGDRIYRLLLRLLPFDFQREYGNEMEAVFRRQRRRARDSGRAANGLLLWWRAGIGVFATAPREHYDMFKSDIRYALRALAKSPAFTFTALAALALGIGANSAIFSAINAVLLHPAGLAEPDRVVAVRVKYDKLNLKSIVISPRDFIDVRDSQEIFASAAIAQPADFGYAAGDLPERLSGLAVTWQWFDVLGVEPIAGRLFRPEEDQPNSNRVAILSYGAWRRLFNFNPAILEQTIQLNQNPYRVVGILGPNNDLGIGGDGRLSVGTNDVFTPLGLSAQTYAVTNGFNQSYFGLARLQPGISHEKAASFMSILTQRGFERPFGAISRESGWGLFIVPYIDFVAGDVKTPLFVLLGAVGFVLLIACSNIAGLMLGRATGRSREFAVRTALGASRWHLVRQALAESLVLAIAGSLLGLGLAYAGTQAATALAPPAALGGVKIVMDFSVLLFTAGVGVFSGVLSGIVPACQIARSNIHDVLKESGRSAMSGRGPLRLRSILITGQVALALILLVGAGLFLRSLVRLQQVDTGFQPEGVLSAFLTLPGSGYREPEKRVAFYRAAVERLAALPGVTSAAAAMGLPFAGSGAASFRIVGREARAGGPDPNGEVRWITPGYFPTLRIPLKKGRVFTDEDSAPSQRVVLIDENLARQYWPNEDPIGQQILRTVRNAVPWTIVGIVAHVKQSDLADDPGKGVVYFPLYQQALLQSAVLIVRTTTDPDTLANGMREAIRSVDPAQPVYDIKTMEARVSTTLGLRRFAVVLLGTFAAVALLMAGIGLYGLINYLVKQRTQEIGIRVALGARPLQIVRLVLEQGVRLTLAGVGIGLVGALLLTQLISSQLFQVSAFDAATFASMSLVILVVAVIASYLPARRATKIDPLDACRHE